jgi:predicted hydrocarbon binding protein
LTEQSTQRNGPIAKEIPIYVKNPGKKSYQLLVRLENVPGALAEAAAIVERASVNALGGIVSVSKDQGYWCFFAESSSDGPSAEELVARLRRSKHVLGVEAKEDIEGFLVDTLTFPLKWNTGDRAILMRQQYLVRMFDDIRREFGTGGDVILYREGYAYGRSTWESLEGEIGSEYIRSHFGEVLRIYQAAGWGRVEVVEQDFADKRATIRMHECFECEGHESERPLSSFVRGHLAGAFSALMGAEGVICEETVCAAKGDGHCEFVLRGTA